MIQICWLKETEEMYHFKCFKMESMTGKLFFVRRSCSFASALVTVNKPSNQTFFA
jgi:hypothetical protein